MRGVRRSHTPLLPPIKGETDRGRTGVALGLTRPQPWWPLVAPDCPCYLALRPTTPLKRTVVALRDLLGPLEREVAGDLRLG